MTREEQGDMLSKMVIEIQSFSENAKKVKCSEGETLIAASNLMVANSIMALCRIVLNSTQERNRQ